MNILKQQLGLERWQELNGELSHIEYHLYFVIMFQLNKAKWEMPYKIPAATLMHKTGIKDKVELKRVRDRLIRKGLIEYTDRLYALLTLYDTQSVTECDTEDVTEIDTNLQPFETSTNSITEPFSEDCGNKSVTEGVTQSDTQCVTKKQPNVIPNLSTSKERKEPKERNNINININNNKNTRTRARKTPTIQEVLDSVQSDKLREWLTKFVEHRKKLNKPLTGYALQLIIRKLDNLSPDEGLQCEMLEQSILNAWQNVYPLKDDIVYKASHDNTSGTCITGNVSDVSEIERMFMRQYAEEG